ncbi:hypothetical protein [Cohnella fermenti]|uniref:Uncharacterized protein n=1 Tax=Cohnella fermenti TaxID=2565925 RepID=A0A4S4BLL5_9BACL|nr:hypothetical protein [Cohnella fermenti]THF73223.1 hypothetical protein E6C55_30215 [Cohnella fermenti]
MTVIFSGSCYPHSTLRGLKLDYLKTAMLLSIARLHCKLAIEHGKVGTMPERRRQIIEEIQSLRAMRDDLIAEWRKDVKN